MWKPGQERKYSQAWLNLRPAPIGVASAFVYVGTLECELPHNCPDQRVSELACTFQCWQSEIQGPQSTFWKTAQSLLLETDTCKEVKRNLRILGRNIDSICNILFSLPKSILFFLGIWLDCDCRVPCQMGPCNCLLFNGVECKWCVLLLGLG